jgi:hypothetical protein
MGVYYPRPGTQNPIPAEIRLLPPGSETYGRKLFKTGSEEFFRRPNVVCRLAERRGQSCRGSRPGAVAAAISITTAIFTSTLTTAPRPSR